MPVQMPVYTVYQLNLNQSQFITMYCALRGEKQYEAYPQGILAAQAKRQRSILLRGRKFWSAGASGEIQSHGCLSSEQPYGSAPVLGVLIEVRGLCHCRGGLRHAPEEPPRTRNKSRSLS